MSEENTNGQESANRQHNVADVKRVIKECADIVARVKAGRKELNEDMAGVRKRIKDNGVQSKVFEHACRIAEMELDAQGTWIDDMKLCFEALSVGGQSSMLDTFDKMAETGQGSEATH